MIAESRTSQKTLDACFKSLKNTLGEMPLSNEVRVQPQQQDKKTNDATAMLSCLWAIRDAEVILIIDSFTTTFNIIYFHKLHVLHIFIPMRL